MGIRGITSRAPVVRNGREGIRGRPLLIQRPWLGELAAPTGAVGTRVIKWLGLQPVRHEAAPHFPLHFSLQFPHHWRSNGPHRQLANTHLPCRRRGRHQANLDGDVASWHMHGARLSVRMAFYALKAVNACTNAVEAVDDQVIEPWK